MAHLVKPSVKTLHSCSAKRIVRFSLVAYINSASHVINMVQVKPRMDKKVKRRCSLSDHDPSNKSGPPAQAYLQNGLLPQSSQGLYIAFIHGGNLDLGTKRRLLHAIVIRRLDLHCSTHSHTMENPASKTGRPSVLHGRSYIACHEQTRRLITLGADPAMT